MGRVIAHHRSRTSDIRLHGHMSTRRHKSKASIFIFRLLCSLNIHFTIRWGTQKSKNINSDAETHHPIPGVNSEGPIKTNNCVLWKLYALLSHDSRLKKKKRHTNESSLMIWWPSSVLWIDVSWSSPVSRSICYQPDERRGRTHLWGQ